MAVENRVGREIAQLCCMETDGLRVTKWVIKNARRRIRLFGELNGVSWNEQRQLGSTQIIARIISYLSDWLRESVNFWIEIILKILR